MSDDTDITKVLRGIHQCLDLYVKGHIRNYGTIDLKGNTMYLCREELERVIPLVEALEARERALEAYYQ